MKRVKFFTVNIADTSSLATMLGQYRKEAREKFRMFLRSQTSPDIPLLKYHPMLGNHMWVRHGKPPRHPTSAFRKYLAKADDSHSRCLCTFKRDGKFAAWILGLRSSESKLKTVIFAYEWFACKENMGFSPSSASVRYACKVVPSYWCCATYGQVQCFPHSPRSASFPSNWVTLASDTKWNCSDSLEILFLWCLESPQQESAFETSIWSRWTPSLEESNDFRSSSIEDRQSSNGRWVKDRHDTHRGVKCSHSVVMLAKLKRGYEEDASNRDVIFSS